MSPAQAARILGVDERAEWSEVRAAYRLLIRSHHPDHAGAASAGRAARIIEAYEVLDRARSHAGDPSAPSSSRSGAPPPPPPPPSDKPTDVGSHRAFWRASRWPAPVGRAPAVWRVDDDTLLLDAPAEETFRWLLDAAYDVGEVTYVDGSVPIMEVLCRFEGEPATSLLITLQGRANGTEAFCTVESIEDRPAPPVAAVVDLLELALHRRTHPEP